MNLIAKTIWRTYEIWSRFIPSVHRSYKLPTGGNVYIDISESQMMLARVLGQFEPQKHTAIEYFLQQGESFIDIGSNKGEFAIHASLVVGPYGKAVCFEPEPTNCHWIRKSIDKSEIKNIELVEAAIGAEEGHLDLYIGKKSGWHSVVKSENNFQKDSVSVAVIQLDKWLDKNPLPKLKAIKIDVEGFEEEVLSGANKTLENTDDLILFIDIHLNNGVDHGEIFNILKNHNFSLFAEQHPFNVPILEGEKPTTVLAIKNQTTAG